MRTDYLGIHRTAYCRIIREGRSGWSTVESALAAAAMVQEGLRENGIEPGRTLELGCGDGSVSLALAEAGFQVSGIDIVPEAVEWARRKAARLGIAADFTLGSATELPWGNGTFQTVLDASCSHCIIGSDRDALFTEVWRVLKPGGLFVMNCLCGDPSPELLPFFDPDTRCLVRNGTAGRYLGCVESILTETESSGFINRSWREILNDHGDAELVLYCLKPL